MSQFDETTGNQAPSHASRYKNCLTSRNYGVERAYREGRDSAKASLEILARAFLSKSECYCHALFNKPCDHCKVIAQVRAEGNWPLEEA